MTAWLETRMDEIPLPLELPLGTVAPSSFRLNEIEMVRSDFLLRLNGMTRRSTSIPGWLNTVLRSA